MVKAHDKLAKNSEKLLKDMGKVRKTLFPQHYNLIFFIST